MYWFRRPPYLRWALAALIVAAATAAELRGERTVVHPFVARPVAAGEAIGPGALEWRRVPAGLLPATDPATGVAARPLTPGEPVLPSSIGAGVTPPGGWWSIPIDVPPGTTVGAEVRVVVVPVDGTASDPVPGLVVAPPGEDSFGARTPGLVAVPGELAATVAAATARDQVVVLVAPEAAGAGEVAGPP